ncbi:MAG: sigma 54-interacting transcriptional regulator [Methylococcales bacterium]|nr:sigma 54-interacting transcriptional regulator [Methylococcales bacterium]
MKQSKAITDFLEKNTAWLAQFNRTDLLTTMMALCDLVGFYILDNEQKVRYWSTGAESLTGFKRAELLGNVCPPDYAVTNADHNTATELELTPANTGKNTTTPRYNHPLRIKKINTALYAQASTDISRVNNAQFAGGFGLLLKASDKLSSSTTPAKASADTQQDFQGILSRSPAMQDVFHIIKNAAETASTVLVRGESGAGKELVAKAIHDLSVRRNAPFLAINCAALSSNLLESELFGHVRGAFTGAIKDHSGLFQRAQGGTLFLDEVAELPLELQAKLLRVIQERNCIPVGGDHQINTDVRIVAATHRSLREEVKNGRFREDLMYRLRVVPIFIPPLRERREDISLLIWHFIHEHNSETFRKIEKVEPQAMRAFLDYQWPGNIRELHNVIEYAFAVGRGSTLRYSELPPEFREPRIRLDQPLRAFKAAITLTPEQEITAIRDALTQHNGAVTAAANSVGMSRATFWRKRKLYNL